MENPVAKKLCPKCEEEKPVTEFWKNKKKKDGLCCYCKKCGKKHQQDWYEKTHKKAKKKTGEEKTTDETPCQSTVKRIEVRELAGEVRKHIWTVCCSPKCHGKFYLNYEKTVEHQDCYFGECSICNKIVQVTFT